jgi:hypothetical protein
VTFVRAAPYPEQKIIARNQELVSWQQGISELGGGGERRTWLEGGLAERLLGEGADVAGGVERGREALHQPPLVPVRRRRHCDRLTGGRRRRLGLG